MLTKIYFNNLMRLKDTFEKRIYQGLIFIIEYYNIMYQSRKNFDISKLQEMYLLELQAIISC